MIDFHTPTLADKPWVDHCLAQGEHLACEYNFTTLFTWAPGYQITIAQTGGFLTARLRGPRGCAYLWPAGEGDLAAVLDALEADARERGEPFQLVCLTRAEADVLEQLRPGQFDFADDRDGHDYLYEVDKLSDLAGRKLHGKRNHCKRFEEENPDWTYEVMTAGSVDECMAMDAEWDRRSRIREGVEEEEDISNEKKALLLAFRNFQALGLEGGILRVEGQVVAFTMGDRLSTDAFDVHFEKAYSEMQGAFAVINREFARHVRSAHPEVKYLNREDDMGIEGLRRAKESYYPDRMVEKFLATRK